MNNFFNTYRISFMEIIFTLDIALYSATNEFNIINFTNLI